MAHRVLHLGPVFFIRPLVFYETPCFPQALESSTRPLEPVFPPDLVFSTPRVPVPRTPGPRPRVFYPAFSN